MRRFRLVTFQAALLIAASSVFAGRSIAAEVPTAAERLRAALARVHEVDIPGQPLPDAVQTLCEQTGLTFVLDGSDTEKAAAEVTRNPGFFGAGSVLGSGGVGLGGLNAGAIETTNPPLLEFQANELPLRVALRQALEPLGLCAVIVGNRVVIASPTRALALQMGQAVSLDLDRREVADVLRDLGRATGVNVILDPKVSKDARAPLTLRLDDTPLESAVAVLADAAGLRSVRLGNVLYVTSDSRVEMLRRDHGAGGSGGLPRAPSIRTGKPLKEPPPER